MQYSSREVYEYISKTTNDPIIEWKICTVSGVEFPIYQSDLDFYVKISPIFAGQKFQIPTPTLCPEERQRRRLSFRNERKLYKRTCDATGKNIISIYSPDKPYTVYDQSYRWSDKRDPMSYGFEFDFSKTVRENFRELSSVVPLMNIMNDNGVGSVNSEYCNNFSYGKNCYMIHTSRHGEDSMYCSSCQYISHTHDSEGMGYTINCHDCVDCNKLTNCSHLQSCDGCADCFYGESLLGCTNCFCCFNLTNQSFYILNQSHSKEDYVKLMSDEKFVQKTISEYQKIIPMRRAMPIANSENSLGAGIFDSSNIIMGYNIYRGKDCKYYYGGADSPRSSYDITVGGDHDYGYESIVPDLGYYTLFTIYCWKCQFVVYSTDCHSSSYLFGCIGLRNKQYCIFNRQYTKEEYEIQVAKIIQHMIATGERGEFFHPSLSPFGYNETVAQEYYPLHSGHHPEHREGSILVSSLHSEGQQDINFTDYGYKRFDYNSDPKIPDTAQVIRPTEIGDEDRARLTDTDDILRQVILCEISNRPYMIQKAELEFYRKHKLLIPRKHPDIRHEERMKLRPGRTLHLRTCDCCDEEMLSVYSQDHEGKVYCESCYQQQVFR